MSWRSAAMRADRALFGNYSDQFSYPFLFIVSLLCAIVCSASLFFWSASDEIKCYLTRGHKGDNSPGFGDFVG